MDTAPVLDLYAPLSHKQALDPANQRTASTVPSWVPSDDQRRLTAYYVLESYRSNTARNLLPADSPRLDLLREYGDAELLVDRIVAGTLGTDWSIAVDGADFDVASLTLPPRPPDAPDSASAPEKALVALQQKRWDDEATALVDDATEALTVLPDLQDRLVALLEWADRVHLASRIDEGEHDAAGLGDAVYVLWPRTGDWPAVSLYDPGHYFPALDDDGEVSDYPEAVVLAWEYEVTVDGTTTRHLRRITFELTEIAALRTDGDGSWTDAEGLPAGAPVLYKREHLGVDGRIRRRYPWTPSDADDAALSPLTCVMSDGTWNLSETSISGLADLSDSAATWTVLPSGAVVRDLDLAQDFLPVVHVPNTASSKEHYGRSVLSPVAQILDDLAGADTDTVQSARYLSDPTLALSGAKVAGTEAVAPGTVFGLGVDGRMDVLDLSAGLDKLMGHRGKLADRFWTNGRVPKSIAGTISAADVPSGIALALEMAPFASLIGGLRMARDPKYRLLFKFAQRMAQLQKALPEGETPVARMAWGNFLPTNRTETATIVAGALTAHAISTHTAVQMLVAAGFPIPDAAAEVERIRAEDERRAAVAKDLADATGSEQVAADWFGVDLPEAATGGEPPVIELP